MGSAKTYKELIVWQKSIDLVEEVYKVTNDFPESEKYGISAQIRKSVISISSNIAERWGREYSKSFLSFLRIERGSIYELETQIIIAKRLGYIKKEIEVLEDTLDHVGKMLNKLIASIKSKNAYLEEDSSIYSFSAIIDSQKTNNESRVTSNE